MAAPGTVEADVLRVLPANYQFEVPRTVSRIKQIKAKRVALQFPEGLLQFSIAIADIISHHANVETVILGDVTYGACCVDDLAGRALGCDFLVHYGHSCLISIKDCVVPKMMYVFVEIGIDVEHFIETTKALVPPSEKLAVFSTIQFVVALRAASQSLSETYGYLHMPQVKPLSCGEVLGCTSPIVPEDVSTVVYLGDGRFHLESVMIHNPSKRFLQYDPYVKKMTAESYDYEEMMKTRFGAIQQAKNAQTFALILGTLGRQGSPRILERLEAVLRNKGKKFVTYLVSELSIPKVEMLGSHIEAAIQIACPRLSIDWGHHFPIPLLSPYEAEVALGVQEWRPQYPMDHYAREGGKWAVYTDKTLDDAAQASNQA
eukprot:PhM_4_TR6921/c0_g1_i1/m.80579/K07561/DPH1, dph2; 2-(3-amino-3-carboxypropyl)histidine synthase